MKMGYIMIALAVMLLMSACTKQGLVSGGAGSDQIPVPGSSQSGGTLNPGTDNPQGSQVKIFRINAANFAFTPNVIEVNKGDTVRIIAVSSDGNHGITIPDFGVSMDLPQGQEATAEFVADKKGTFRFFCNVPCGPGHSSMTGTVVVS
jgi:cytochrome c oxidase subunit 2